MKYFALILLLGFSLLLGFAGCDLIDNNGTGERPPLAPEGTVYISGAIEANADTAAFYGPPEVFVGTVEDMESARWYLLEDPSVTVQHHLWSPTVYGQVVRLLDRIKLRPVGDEAASVTVTGPLRRPGEQTVRLQHKASGVYADLAGALAVVPDAHYRLDATLSDGRAYSATAYVPEAPAWTLPDTTSVPVRLSSYSDTGGAMEEGLGEYPTTWQLPSDTSFVVAQSNAELWYERHLWRLQPGERFFREDAGHHRREGSYYAIMDGRTDPLVQTKLVWSGGCEIEPITSLRSYSRVSVLGPEFAEMYWPELSEHAQSNSDGSHELFVRRVWGDGGVGKPLYDYLHARSNVRRAGVSTSESDALGVFGGYASIYRTTVMVPERDFDITAVPNWPCD